MTDDAAPANKERELERVLELRGFRYGLHDFWAEYDVEALKTINDGITKTYLNEEVLDRKTKELLLIVTCTAIGDMVGHLQVHMHAANQAGASPEEIMDALNVVKGWMGAVRWNAGIEAWRAAFRPDIPTIDRVVAVR